MYVLYQQHPLRIAQEGLDTVKLGKKKKQLQRKRSVNLQRKRKTVFHAVALSLLVAIVLNSTC